MVDQESVKVFISNKDWESLCEGRAESIRIWESADLHHQFGDDYESEVVPILISKMEEPNDKSEA